MTIKNRVSLSN
ncbi:hypothetical protein D027_0799A, partial [Vibrio parahaemolyticus 861]